MLNILEDFAYDIYLKMPVGYPRLWEDNYGDVIKHIELAIIDYLDKTQKQ